MKKEPTPEPDLKTESEIAKMRETGRIVHRAIHETAKIIKPGITTNDLEDYAVSILKSFGSTSPCFLYQPGDHPPYPAWTCVSINEEVVHGIPGNRVIREGDIVTIDICAEQNGWVADSAWTFPVGKVDARTAKLLQVTEQALAIGIAHAKPGKMSGEIGYAVQKYVERNGFRVVETLQGHGVGRSMHEDGISVPNFGSRKEGILLEVGMTFAIEPMINMGRKEVVTQSDGWTIVTEDGKNSAHFEHTIAILPGGAQILTCA